MHCGNVNMPYRKIGLAREGRNLKKLWFTAYASHSIFISLETLPKSSMVAFKNFINYYA
jgi:hypothetical protein